MKVLVLILSLTLLLEVKAAETESAWKQKLRSLISQVVGANWADRLLGEDAALTEELPMPTIPPSIKKATSVDVYKSVQKESKEYDGLSPQQKRQLDYNYLKELFLVTRQTEARDEDLSTWLNTLDQGGSREGVYQALVLDEVYSAMENMEERPDSKLISFSLEFSQKFLNQTFKTESLQQLNLFSLKRILTEKGLDLMEYYELNDLDALFRWYAHFSSYLAKSYSTPFTSRIRREQAPGYHYEWAKKMPLQHIKSEFILKLHSVMNSLQ